MAPVLVCGSYDYVKRKILEYCFGRFDYEQIWLVDSLQVFDPYRFSRVDVARTRRMLDGIKVSRPFNFYQLRDRIFSFTKIRLDEHSTIIVSGMDCFDDGISDNERKAQSAVILRVLKRLECRIILCFSSRGELEHASKELNDLEFDKCLGEVL